jgi:hypothetical protein
VQGWTDDFWTNLATYAPLPIMLAVLVGPGAAAAAVPLVLPRRDQPGLRAHRARQGLPERRVMLKHVLRNAMIPILTNIGIYLPGLFVGSFLLEVFFAIPGLGREIIGGEPQRLPGHQGGDGVPRGADDGREPAGRRGCTSFVDPRVVFQVTGGP